MNSVITRNEKETESLGKKFAKKLLPGDVVFLYGDLGFGKTTFVKGIAQGMEIKSKIISPTFPIIRQHGIKNSFGNTQDGRELRIMNLYHVDLYRIEEKDQLKGLGLHEILRDESSIKLIEWPEKLELTSQWNVMIELNTDNTRTFNIIKNE